MARTRTFDASFQAGFAVGVSVSRACGVGSPGSGSTAAANTVNVSQQASPEAHPLAAVSGLFAGDPLWPEYLEAVRKIREEDEDADE